MIKSPALQALTVLVTVVFFSVPFASGSFAHFIYAFTFLLLFPLLVLWQTRNKAPSLLGRLKHHHPVLFYLLAGFAVSSLLSYLRILFIEVTLEQKAVATLRYVSCLLLAFYSFMLARLTRVSGLSHQRLFSVFVAGVLVLVVQLAGIFYFFDAPNAANWGIDPPLGTHVRVMGMVAEVAIVSLACLVWLARLTKIQSVLAYVSLFIIAGFLVWTGSRMSILASLLVLAILAAYCRYYQRTQWLKIAAVFMVAFLSAPIAEKMAIYEWSGLQRAIKVSSVSEMEPVSSVADKISSGRVEIWKAALNAAMDAPVLGLGPFGYFFVEDRPPRYEHTHNALIEFIVEWGILGASLLSAFLLGLFYHAVKALPQAIKQAEVGVVMAISVLAVLNVNALTDGIYFIIVPSIVLATACSAMPYALKRRG